MMIFGTMKWYVYLMIAAIVAALTLIFGLAAGDQVIQIITEMRNIAMASGGLPQPVADLIAQPIIFAFQGEIINSLLVGIFWPLALVWLILFVILLFFAYIVPGAGIAGDQIGG
ncbi:MAG: hypothetical protein H6670_02155 [Anaerolineaceae bacterium]|nr:hypothetical protein [Anaerolineaceae bacterium]